MSQSPEKIQQHNEVMLEYYYNNKEKVNFTRVKNHYRADLGKEIVDKIYEVYNGDMNKIRPVIAFLRAKQKFQEMAESIKDVPISLKQIIGI